MAKKLLRATIEQTIRKEIEVDPAMPVGAFSVDALNVINALTAEDHSTIVAQKFLSAEVIEVTDE